MATYFESLLPCICDIPFGVTVLDTAVPYLLDNDVTVSVMTMRSIRLSIPVLVLKFRNDLSRFSEVTPALAVETLTLA